MSNRKENPLSSNTVRIFAIAWMGLVVVAGIITFVVMLLALNSRAERLADATVEAQGLPPVVQATQVEVPEVTPIPPESAEEGPQFDPPATFGLQDTLELGGQVPGLPIEHPQLMHDTDMTWIKFQIKWNPNLDPTQAEPLVTAAHESGLKVLLSITGDPYPQTTIDYASYVTYLGQVAAYQPDAIEVWNEMNLDREWPAAEINGATYVNSMLKPAYETIKAASPNTSVIIGALAPTGAFGGGCGAVGCDDNAYVAQMAQAGAADYADCIGAHHNSGTTSPSARSGHVSDNGANHYSWYFLPTVEVYYNGMGGALPVCLTEFGYLTPDGFDTPISENFQWGNNNTVEEQAAWLAEGVNLSQELGYVPLMIIWNVDFTRWDDDPQGGYAILRPDGTCPACATLKAALAD